MPPPMQPKQPSFQDLMMQMMQNQQSTPPPDIGALAKLINPGNTTIGAGGAEVSEANPMGYRGGNPFTNGFFKTPGGAEWQARDVQVASPNPGRVVADPFDTNGSLLPGVDVNQPLAGLIPPQDFQGNGTQRPIPGGQEGMINSGLPDASRFGDGNFWSAIGGLVPPKPTTLRKPSFGFGTSVPKSPFSFGTARR